MTDERVRLADVALRAGVSAAAASKVFNGRPDVSAGTRERVQRAAAELGYARAGRREPSGRTRLAVVFDTVANYYAPMVLEGLLAEARAHNVDVSVATYTGGRHLPDELEPGSASWLRRAADEGYSGVALITVPVTADRVRACDDRGLPLVTIDPATQPPPGTASVSATNWRGGYQATEHLLELGHRRIGIITGMRDSVPAAERLAGYTSALMRWGVAFDDSLVVEGDFRYETGTVGARYLLGLAEPPTAIFASCDPMAFGVLEVARRLGLRVPQGLSVVGYDDGYAAAHSVPPLTTVRQPLEVMGATAVRALLGMIEHSAERLPVQVETQLVVRASTAHHS